ncbi:MFS family permease [Methanomicrobium sp. W14]|uniref:MFS transporter n=1 Tax=Methanomicrobium sp. W14 TaxID=2817839 RepID=UPI001AE9A9C8|nr:MFS transporter [Methanomicrobium sp. W14]MBP2132217.1 MFS family permease [Methanomicrobium sp. W14]
MSDTINSYENEQGASSNDRHTGRLIFIILASMMTMMGSAAVAPALPQISSFFSNYPDSIIALIIALPSLGVILTGGVIGYICDRIEKVKLLVISLAVFAVFGSSGLYLNSLEYILIGRVFLGISIAGIMTSTTTLITLFYSGKERIKVLGYQTAAMGLGAIVLQTSAGFLAAVGWRETFGIYLLAILFIPGVILTIKEPSKECPAISSEPELSGKKDNIFSPAIAGLLFASIFVVQMMFYTLSTTYPYLLGEIGINSTVASGILLGVPGLISAFSAVSCSRLSDHFSRQTVIAFGFLSFALGLLLIGSFSEIAVSVVGLILIGAGLGFIMVNLVNWLTNIAPVEKAGILFGLFTTFFFLGQFSSGYLTQPLISYFGTYFSAFFIEGLCAVLFTVLFTYLAIKNKKEAKTT